MTNPFAPAVAVKQDAPEEPADVLAARKAHAEAQNKLQADADEAAAKTGAVVGRVAPVVHPADRLAGTRATLVDIHRILREKPGAPVIAVQVERLGALIGEWAENASLFSPPMTPSLEPPRFVVPLPPAPFISPDEPPPEFMAEEPKKGKK